MGILTRQTTNKGNGHDTLNTHSVLGSTINYKICWEINDGGRYDARIYATLNKKGDRNGNSNKTNYK